MKLSHLSSKLCQDLVLFGEINGTYISLENVINNLFFKFQA